MRGVRIGLLLLGLGAGHELRGAGETLTGRAVPHSEYTLAQWTVEDGLPQNNVQALFQDRQGYIWVGTYFGMARFDGLRFFAFNENNTPEMRVNPNGANTLAFAEDNEGSLWIGTAGGLLRRKDHLFELFTTTNGLPHNRVWNLVSREAGGVWIGTHTGIAWFDGEKFHTVPGIEPPKGRPGMAEDDEGRLCFTEAERLMRFDSETATTEVLSEGEQYRREGNAIVIDRSQIWVGSRWGLYCWREGDVDEFHYSSEPARDPIWPDSIGWVSKDPQGDLWFGLGSEQRLGTLEENGFALFTGHPIATNLTVTSFLKDREGNLWLGTYAEGLFCLRPKRVRMLQTGHPNGDNLVTVTEDNEGSIWTGGRVVRWQGDMFTLWPEWLVRNSNGPGTKTFATATSLLASRDGTIYAGHGSHGLWAFKDGRWHKPDHPNLSHIRGYYPAKVLAEDSRGGIWFDQDKWGLFRWDSEALKQVVLPENLRARGVRAVCESLDGAIWIGANGGGVGKYRQGQVEEHFTEADGLSDGRICVLYEDSEGLLWIGTENGLNRLKDGRLYSFYTAHGLFDNMVNHMLEDDFGYFWISCNRGIYRIKRAELNAVADGDLEKASYIAYGESDGMATAETNGEQQTAGYKTRDGRILFPTGKGLAVIDPKTIQDNEVAPPVVIEKVTANGETVFGDGASREAIAMASKDGGIRFPPGSADVLRFTYTANSFVDSKKVLFQYRLIGYDSDWREAGDLGTERVVYYTNLKPGNYQFQVIASNNHGVWNQEGASLSFHIAPRFHQTWMFPAVCGVFALCVAAGIHRGRVHHLRRLQQVEHELALERERARIAEDMHDDVGSRLSEIALLGEIVQKRRFDADFENRLARISESARQTSAALEEIVWAVSPQNDRAARLAEYLCQHIEETVHNAEIRCRINSADDWPDAPVSSEIRHSTFLLVKEALHNAIRHSRATEIRCTLTHAEGHLKFTLEDNGNGFSTETTPSRPGGGHGLLNMRNRIERLGGTFSLHSTPGTGTRIHLCVPFIEA